MGQKVVLGFSGGVDSSVASFLLKEQGYDVTGVFIDITDNDENPEWLAAQKSASSIGIELIKVNGRKSFEKLVIEPFCASYCEAKTPNPCIICNPSFKFVNLIKIADEIGAENIATGHYAGIENLGETYFVKKAASEKKDQSYMLYRLGQDVLSRVIFPLNSFNDKSEVREIAAKVNIDSANKKDSQDICFIRDGDYKSFLTERGIKSRAGNFIDTDGNILGKHSGTFNFTVGQRKGLGIALGKPVFVKSVNAESGDVVLCENDELFQDSCVLTSMFFTKYGPVGRVPEEYMNKEFKVKPRYTASAACAGLDVNEKGETTLRFTQPQRALTPGQSAVIYDGNLVIGGGFIK